MIEAEARFIHHGSDLAALGMTATSNQQLATKMKLVECVPNFSEGRRPDVIAKIRDASRTEGVAYRRLLDQSHNRTVITFVAPVERAVDAAFAGIRTRDSST